MYNILLYRKIICENVEMDLLKDPKFVSTLVGLGFAFVSDVTYLAMEPMLLFSYGFTKVRTAISDVNSSLYSNFFFLQDDLKDIPRKLYMCRSNSIDSN